MDLIAAFGFDMEPTAFLSALLAIIVIDLVLAGDNAIVIALAARNLPPAVRSRAIVWGTIGAIAVRSALTVLVVSLLKIPGLMLAGGALLVWIAWKLLLPEDAAEATEHAPAATGFWGAMRTIVIADAIMGLDNVLGVAGAAHGHYGLVVLGLLISIPVVVWGSTLVLKAVDRFPVIVYVGAGVLAWTAAKMMRSEPVAQPFFAAWPVAGAALYLAIPAVLWAGFTHNHRQLDSRIRARLAAWRDHWPIAADAPAPVPHAEGVAAMLKILVPVDGSTNALRAVRHAIDAYRSNHALEVHLLNVQQPFHRHISRFVSRASVASFHAEQSDQALAPAHSLLASAGVPYTSHRGIGDRAQTITELARSLGAHHIVMGTARKNSLTRMLEDSVTNRVLELTDVPVEVVAGDAVSSLERFGLPAALGAGLGLLWLAAVD